MSSSVAHLYYSLCIYLKDTEWQLLNTELKIDPSCHPTFDWNAPFEFIIILTFIKDLGVGGVCYYLEQNLRIDYKVE